KSATEDLSHHWEAHTALSNPQNRRAFLRTLRAVVDRRGQAVCALNRLHFNAARPVMIISGDQDPVIPIAHARAAHDAMPHSRLHVIPGAAHHPHTEQPDTVASLIDNFIDGNEGIDATEGHTHGAPNAAAVSLADWSASAHSRRSDLRPGVAV